MSKLHRFTRSALAAVIVWCLRASPAAAGKEPRTHDGFFLRLSGGFGAAKAEVKDPSLELSGTSSDANIAVGTVLAPNLALHATLWGWAVSDPDASGTIPGLGTGSGTVSGTLYMSGFGVGGTYYFMPMNSYVSLSLGTGGLSGTDELDGSTKNGFAMDVTVGKEWWVGNDWGLGVSGDFMYLTTRDEGIGGGDVTWSSTAFGLRFSATFN